ncbi:MAG: hypothetical protein JO022_11770 [Acidobacteriaceae bacterium]|nr:hypothetical protein [Acidobacteriaceae bacterium]
MRLFEFGDQQWLPRVLRQAETAYLAVSYKLLPLARAWVDQMTSTLPLREHVDILDLCSGSGGPIAQIVNEFRKQGRDVSVLLTDLYPHIASTEDHAVRWFPSPVDATRVPSDLHGVRTMFSAFHHFDSSSAHAILEDAFRQRLPICIFEAAARTPAAIASMFLVPLNVLAIMPFARPFRWPYLLFTHLIPVLPLMIFWDGLVSVLRIYSPEQMQAMVSDLQAPDYRWQIGALRVRRIPSRLPYLIGVPVAEDSSVDWVECLPYP